MSKFRHRDRSTDGEPLSQGRVEYLEAARARARNRKLRRTAVILIVLTLVVAFATGMVGSSISRLKDVVDTIQIALTPKTGFPQQTGIGEIRAVEPLSGGFVLMGEDSCVVYSENGSRINSIQSGYARPALAAGKTRFVLYNRSGTELRVESRTQNLYTKTMEHSIYLCAVADAGQVAVVTDNTDSMARLTVYSSTMEQLLRWDLTSAEGIPVRMEFAPDSRSIALAAVTAKDGRLSAGVYLLELAQGDPVCLGTAQTTPQWLGWLSADRLVVVFEDRAVLYDATGEKAAYSFDAGQLASVSANDDGVALLLENGQLCTAVLLDGELNVQFSGGVPSANRIVRSAEGFYLLTDNAVEFFDMAGEYQWEQSFAVRPQALHAGKQTLVFCGNTVQQLAPPQQEDAGTAG